jgi:hypothetical protein
MNKGKGKVLVAMLTTLMMVVMAVPLVSALPTAGDEVTRDPLNETQLLGLRIDYRNYGYPDGFPDGWASEEFPGDVGAWAGEMNVTVTDDQGAIPSRLGEEYTAFCLDFYTPIQGGDVLQVDTNLVNDPNLNATEALIVNYIMAMYEPTDDLSGAAIQCAIWFFLTEEYGTYAQMVAGLPPVGARSLSDVQYQFMTDPDPVDPVNDLYDAKINTVSYPSFAADPSVLREAAFVIIDEVEAAMPDLSYPYSISVTPDTQTVNVGDLAPITIEVRDQYGDPFEGALVHLRWMYESVGVWQYDVELTDVNGQIVGYAESDIEDTFHIEACIRGGEAIWVFDPSEPMAIQSLGIPNCVCDDAIAIFEQECYFPCGHTPGFWKENAKKNIEKFQGLPYTGPYSGIVYDKVYKGNGIQVTKEDYEHFLDTIEGKYAGGGIWNWLYFNGTWAAKLDGAFKILNYGGSDPMLKAQKHMLSALLTVQWYDHDGVHEPGWYEGGCVQFDDGSTMNIGDAIAEMMNAYAAGDYEWAHEIAGALNEQCCG